MLPRTLPPILLVRMLTPLHPFLLTHNSANPTALLPAHRLDWAVQYFYVLLDGALPPTPDPLSVTTAVKVVVDQFVQAPVFTVIIFGVSTYFEVMARHRSFLDAVLLLRVGWTMQNSLHSRAFLSC